MAKTTFNNPTTGKELEDGLNNNFNELYNKVADDRAISHTYIASGDEVPLVISTPDVPKKYQLPVTVKKINNFGLKDIGGGVLALEYQGTREITCTITASSSMQASANNVEVIFYLYKNGQKVPGASIERKIGTGSDLGAMALAATFEAQTGDYFEIFVETDVACSITLLRTNVVIAEF